jgi:uncharacterized protein (TIGR00266 family)
MQHKIMYQPSYSLLELQLDPSESVLAESDAMVSMSPNIAMETGAKGGLFGALKRVREMQGESLFVQSGSFLASSPSIDLDTKWGGARTFFSREGLFVLKATGTGMLFLSSYGAIHAVTLAPGEQLVMDTGHMVAFDATMGYHVRTIGGVKETLLSGEGLVVDLTGPGTIYMQTRNFSAFVRYLAPKLPQKHD